MLLHQEAIQDGLLIHMSASSAPAHSVTQLLQDGLLLSWDPGLLLRRCRILLLRTRLRTHDPLLRRCRLLLLRSCFRTHELLPLWANELALHWDPSSVHQPTTQVGETKDQDTTLSPSCPTHDIVHNGHLSPNSQD